MQQEKKREEIPLPKLLEAITPYQAGIYVTVLNIIQCIALAFLINEAREVVIKGELGLVFIMRSAVALIIILVVWHRYVAESQYLWPMSWWDTVIPFSMGMGECAVVFSTDDNVSLRLFIIFIAIVQLLAFFAYWHAYRKRNLKVTKKLYQTAYRDYPEFVFCLSMFLSIYDLRNAARFAALAVLSFMFICLIFIHYFFLYELIFPMFYLFESLRAEIKDSFHRALTKDVFLRPYFE